MCQTALANVTRACNLGEMKFISCWAQMCPTPAFYLHPGWVPSPTSILWLLLRVQPFLLGLGLLAAFHNSVQQAAILKIFQIAMRQGWRILGVKAAKASEIGLNSPPVWILLDRVLVKLYFFLLFFSPCPMANFPGRCVFFSPYEFIHFSIATLILIW